MMRKEKQHSDLTSPEPSPGEHALRVLERRNAAFGVLYDTVMDVENADEAVYEILCRNLKRLCRAACAAVASYNPETHEVLLQAVETDLLDVSTLPAEELSARQRLTENEITDLRQTQLLPCREGGFRLREMLPKRIRKSIRRNERGRCRQMSCIRGGSLLALGMVYHPDGRDLHDRDIVDTYLSLAGVVLQRMEATRELRNRERRYRSLIEATGTGYVITDEKGCVLDANDQYVRMTGRKTLSELLGISILEWIAPEDRRRYQNALSACTDTEAVRHFQITLQTPDGEDRDVEINASWVCIEGKERVLALCSDVSMRKVAEARYAQAQKLEAIGQLAAGIAHEINTPTQFVGDNVRFLGESVQNLLTIIEQQRELLNDYRQGRRTPEMDRPANPFDERAKLEYLFEEVPMAVQQTIEGITRVSNIVSAMKEFSHPGAKEMTLLDLNLTLEKTLTVTRNEWQHSCRLETKYDSSLPLVPCFADEIHQVFLNVIVNAAHAVKDAAENNEWNKGTLRIETRYRQPWVEVLISDTGPGIPKAIQEQVFHPFFTTKEVGRGTGQGLSLAKSAVEKHGGEISFQTEEGKGTTFLVRLPVTQSNLSEEQTFGQVA